ncbi:DUF1295 domain-containing protein [Knoellia sp. CPCC 206435]|uniref:DUF1295 domain-containing protein n=1 Tax=Knoellia terrae TaxID=3404797 RepID=UPI003B42BA7B
MRHILVTTVAALLNAAGVMGVTAVVSRRLGRLSVVDVSWGLVLVAIAWVTYAVGTRSARSLLLAVLVTVWGARLAWHIRRRALGGAPGVLTVVSPVVMTYVLAFATGARLLESEMASGPATATTWSGPRCSCPGPRSPARRLRRRRSCSGRVFGQGLNPRTGPGVTNVEG